MAKLPDYEFKGMPQGSIDFKDDIRSVINNGNYQFSFGAGTPTYNASPCQLYFRVNSSSVEFWVCRSANTWIRVAQV